MRAHKIKENNEFQPTIYNDDVNAVWEGMRDQRLFKIKVLRLQYTISTAFTLPLFLLLFYEGRKRVMEQYADDNELTHY